MSSRSLSFLRQRPRLRRGSAVALAAGLGLVVSALALAPSAAPNTRSDALASGTPLDSVTVRPAAAGERSAYDGVVEALRQTTLAAQVSGAVTEVAAKVGDRVRAGQVLVRLDARAARQTSAASEAQVGAAQAALELARRDFERQQQLARDGFISAAALERAQAQFRATQAELAAQVAGAGAMRTQSEFYVLRAPYDGIVSEVPAVLGDMAMPGRALVTVYDPLALRVVAAVPQSAALPAADGSAAQVELPALARERAWVTPARVQRVPAIDPSTHTQLLRLDLPAAIEGVSPGQFARVWLPALPDGASPQRVWLPASAVVQRAELAGVYVLRDDGAPALRQVRLGRRSGERVEVLTGLLPGERVATDAQLATARR